MSRRGVVFLGDLVRTVSLLRPQDTSTATAMARRLALGPGESDRLPRVGCASGPTSGPEAQLDRWGGEAPQPSPVPSAVAEHRPGETDESVQHAYQDGGRQRNASAAPRIPSLDPTGPTNLTPGRRNAPSTFSDPYPPAVAGRPHRMAGGRQFRRPVERDGPDHTAGGGAALDTGVGAGRDGRRRIRPRRESSTRPARSHTEGVPAGSAARRSVAGPLQHPARCPASARSQLWYGPVPGRPKMAARTVRKRRRT